MRRLYRMILQRSEMDSTGLHLNCTYTREFDVIPAKGAPYWPSITQYTRVRVKPDIFEKFKINISARCIHTKLSTRKRLNTKNLLLI